MIPANLLSLALGVIQPQGVQLSKFTGRTTNQSGMKVNAYAAAVGIEGSVQPVPMARYAALGLDMAKTYVTLFTPANVVGVARDGSGDKFTYNGDSYVCESYTDWAAQNGWVAVVAVKVAP